jgi:hypothetical protein
MQISPVRPSKHKKPVPSSNSRNKLNDILVPQFVDMDVSSNFSFPLFLKLFQLFFVGSVDLLDLLDRNIGSLTIKLFRLQICEHR